MGRHVEIEWQETAAELKQMYRAEKHPQRRTRLHALWWMRQGKTMAEISPLLGVHYRTVQRWAAWYRIGGVTEVLKRTAGHAAPGRKPYLSSPQQKALLAQVARGKFHSVWEVLDWVEQRWDVRFRPGGMYDFLDRHDANLKVPRPQATQTNPEIQEQWKKGVSSQP